MSAAPAERPCGSCPYRRDVPSGIWAEEEYNKLPEYDLPTGEQPVGIFLCHQQNGRMCAGWVGCHDMEHSLALRMAEAFGTASSEDVVSALDYISPIPLFSSGEEAARHGRIGVVRPEEDAVRVIQKLKRRRELRA